MYDLGPDFGDATVAPGSNILIAGPPLSGKRRLAVDALERGSNAGEGVIVVTTRDNSQRIIDDFRTILDDPESTDLGIVDCVTKHQGRNVRDSEMIKYASSPVDMTGIGIKFSEFVEEFYRNRGIEKNRVMFDSLSTLLMYSNLQTVFRFMHVFTSRIENADAVGIHTIESTAHDEETMNTLKQLFDGIVRTDEDRNVTLQLPGVDTSAAEP
ncbi:RAD55 family ATPase [Halorientalis marina]|jgi:KaiC/GvpD/RAD55 family RecA-like ATPase|uniref:RAD55 family ATPase n=1 Tax=Halorientalis marina TaxID=2931976 RepID=UPI001FF6FC64|nr:ATPase domain-containing protein [Halorientalis marina]